MFSHLKGFSLLEVLVSLMLLAFALFGYDALEIMAVRASRADYFFNVAANQMQAVSERLGLVREGTEVSQVVAAWNEKNAALLPQGIGVMQASTITIYWGEQSHSACQTIEIGQTGCLQQNIALKV